MKSPHYMMLGVAALLGGAPAAAQVPVEKPAAPKPRLVQAPTEAMTQKARALYADGLRAYEQARFGDAHAAFLAAWALEKHYTIACNLGDVEARLSRFREAAEHLRTCSGGMAKDPKKTEAEKADALALFGQARKKVLSLRTRTNVPAELRVDGVATGGEEIYLEPGKHTVEARADGYELARAEVEGQAGDVRDVTLELRTPTAVPTVTATASATAAASATAVATAPPPSRTLVIGGAALAGAALVMGGVLLGVSISTVDGAQQKTNELLAGNGSCVAGASNFAASCAEIENATRTADTLNRAAIGVWIGGGALAAATALYFFWPRAAATSSGLRIVPVASTTGGAFVASGEW